MRPLALSERLQAPSVSLSELLSGKRAPITGTTGFALADYTEEVLASGLPGLRPLSDRSRRRQLDGYVDRIVDRTLLGALFESLATLSVRVYAAHSEARVKHLRTARGRREIDLIVERADGSVVAIEVKLARTASSEDAKHLTWLKQTLGDRVLDQVTITTGPMAYRREDGIAVIPLALLGP